MDQKVDKDTVQSKEVTKESAHNQLHYKKMKYVESGPDGMPDLKGEKKVVRERVMLTPIQADQLNLQKHNSGEVYIKA